MLVPLLRLEIRRKLQEKHSEVVVDRQKQTYDCDNMVAIKPLRCKRYNTPCDGFAGDWPVPEETIK